jgi:HKD family nuclease
LLSIRVLRDAKAFGRALSDDLRHTERLSIAVAFAKETALLPVDVEKWCHSGGQLRFLAGTDYWLTELQLLRRLEMNPLAQCRIYHSVGPQIFHPKLYVLEGNADGIVYVGSSNFTQGGLFTNVEVNMRLETSKGATEFQEAKRTFDDMFDGEFATPILPEFEAGYRELQEARNLANMSPHVSEAAERFRITENLLLGRYRARVAVRRWLFVVTPENYHVCMRERVWGRQQEHEAKGYSPGDIFLFHVTQGRGIAAMGIVTGAPFYDDSRILWPSNRRGVFPWRVRLLPLGELRTGIPTRETLEPHRPGEPKNWFHGFIQQSHELAASDFDALFAAFEQALRTERSGIWAA